MKNPIYFFGIGLVIAYAYAYWTTSDIQMRIHDVLNPQPVPACMIEASGTTMSVSNCDLGKSWVQLWIKDVQNKIKKNNG